MSKSIPRISLILLLIASMTLVGIPRVRAALPCISLNPMEITVSLGETFTVDVNVTDVPATLGYEFKLAFNTTLLNATAVTPGPVNTEAGVIAYTPLKQVDSTYVWVPLQNVSDGFVWAGCMFAGTFNGSGTLMTINFTALAVGDCTLDLYGTVFGSPAGEPIEHEIGPDATVTVLAALPYTLTITSTSGGTTSPAPGSYQHLEGTVVNVTAIPGSGYNFDHWKLDGADVGDANPYSVTMDDNHTLHAVFTEAPPPTYNLTITSTSGGTTNPSPGSYTYDEGTVVDVRAIPDSGYVFDHWVRDGSEAGAEITISVTVDADHTLHAVFTEASSPTYISLNPMEITVSAPGETFTVDVNIHNVTNMKGYEFKLGFNTTLLTVTGSDEYGRDTEGNVVPGPAQPEDPMFYPGKYIDYTYYWTPLQNITDGFVYAGAFTIVGAPFTGSGTLFTINFTALAVGDCTLHLYGTVFSDPMAQEIPVDISPDATVTVIPEFPAAIVTPLLLITTLVATFLGKMVWSKKRKDTRIAE